MDWEYYLEKLWYKILYSVSVIIYLVLLNNLNKELLLQNFESSFQLVKYNDYAAIKFFVIAFLLILAGILILCKEVKDWKFGKGWNGGFEDIQDMIIAIITILVVIILMILIVKFIMIPILRAILTCAAVLIGVGYAVTH